MGTGTPVIRTSGSEFLGPDGKPLLLRGVCLGGWLNMENFITGYSANETLMRREVRRAIGDDRASAFFERLLTRFFDEPDAAFLGEAGLNLVRIAVGYQHFEDDARPFEIKADGFRHLDRAIEALARAGRLLDHRPARLARLTEPALALRQSHPRPGVLAAPALPGPGRAPVGSHRRPLPRQSLGGRIQPAERASR